MALCNTVQYNYGKDVKDKIRHYKLWPNMLGNFHNKSIMKLKAYAKSTWKYTFRQKWYNFMARQQQQRQKYSLLWMKETAGGKKTS